MRNERVTFRALEITSMLLANGQAVIQILVLATRTELSVVSVMVILLISVIVITNISKGRINIETAMTAPTHGSQGHGYG